MKKNQAALLIVDVITDFEFEDGDVLYRNARHVAKNIRLLEQKFVTKGLPVIYVNDTDEGRIGSTAELMRKAAGSPRGNKILEELKPETLNIVLKPQRSAFFGTDLANRLDRLNVDRVTIAGWTTDICVLFTAHDAFMRQLKVSVPSDCCTAVRPTYHRDALRFLKRVAEADVSPVSKEPRQRGGVS